MDLIINLAFGVSCVILVSGCFVIGCGAYHNIKRMILKSKRRKIRVLNEKKRKSDLMELLKRV